MSGVTLGIRGRYWSTLGPLWSQLWRMRLTVDHCGVNLGSLWDGLGSLLCHFWGSLWDYFGMTFWLFFGSLCWCLAFEAHCWVALGDFGVNFGKFEAEFKSFWDHLGPLWINFGKFLAAFSTYESDFKSFWVDFGIALGSFWGHIGVIFGIWKWLWITLGPLWDNCVVTLGISRSVVKKHSYSPHTFNGFIKLWGNTNHQNSYSFQTNR